ncbi:MAG: metal-dependent transcriptional regulator [Candidatus Lokiarchaeota archaeon]|nr:metal-dependent transcriptional regulator [Candidatus Lokiarchaeota archaeon]
MKIKESYEDYLKVIYLISKRNKKGWVKNSEISQSLCIKPSSVSGMLRNLKEREYIIWKPRNAIRLTIKGKKIATQIIQNSETLKDFFVKVLKVNDKELIKKLCCDIEHHITSEVCTALNNLVNQYNIENLETIV